MAKVDRIESSDKNVIKYVFDFGNAVAEAVLYRYPDYKTRTVMCISTQSGCPVGCRFCGTGDSFVRSLKPYEITYQVTRMLDDVDCFSHEIENWQIMFMSMGEPMLNYDNLEESIRRLADDYPKAKLLISTSGPDVLYYNLIRLSQEYDQIGLQFSIHESTDEARDKLIPFNNKLNLGHIAFIGKRWFEATGRKPFFNYCAGPDNTDIEDAMRLQQLFDPEIWEATISVICERDESIAEANARQHQLALDFMTKLGSLGFSTRCFNPGGQDDIGGGCGQLFHVQKWMKEHPEYSHPTVGADLDAVHSPR